MLKRISLILAATMLLMIVPMGVFAATDAPAPADEPARLAAWSFESNPVIDGWLFVDSDGDGNNWIWYENTYGHAYDGTGNIASFSYVYGLGGDLNPDNWAITPPVQLPSENLSVTFYAKGYLNGYHSEHFAVYAGRTDDPESMSIVLQETVTGSEYTQYTADLSAFANSEVYIAIRHFNTKPGEEALCVDRVEVWGAGEVQEDPFMISEINIEGFTVPAWGEHPDYEIAVPEDAHYSLTYYDWNWEDEDGDYDELPPDAFFDDEALGYYMYMNAVADEGYYFAEDVRFYINGTEEYNRFMFPETLEVAMLTSYFHVTAGGTVPMPGDTDLNGSVNAADALLALRHVMGLMELGGEQLVNAEVDGSEGVTVSDALLIMRYAMGLIGSFPIER